MCGHGDPQVRWMSNRRTKPVFSCLFRRPLGGLMVFALSFTTLLGLTSRETDELLRRYTALDAALQSKEYRQAVGMLKGLVRDYGTSEYGDELRFLLAECYFNAGDFRQAQRMFLEIVEQPRYDYIVPEALYGYAISSIMMASYNEAEQALLQMVKRKGYENDPRANFAFGVVRYYRQDYEGAIAKLNTDSLLEAVLFRGKALARLNQPREALLDFKKITATVPGTPLATLAHFSAGEALFINGDFDGALAKFRFFIENFPNSPLADYAHFFLGCALIHNRRYEEAYDELLPLTKHPNNFLAAHANYFLGYCHLATSRPREAVARFQRVRANFPKSRVASLANLQLSLALLAAGDTAQTILSTSQLSSMFTTGELQAVGDYLSGVLTLQLGQYERSANFFENILIRYPNSYLREPACALLLQALNTAGNNARAVTVGAKYIRDYPDSLVAGTVTGWRPKLLYALAEGYYYLHRFSDAEEYYRRAAESQAAQDIIPYARLGRAYSLLQLDRPDEAIAILRRLVAAKPVDSVFTATVVLGLGFAYYNKGDFDTARLNFEYLTEHFSSLPMLVASGYFYAGMCYRRLDYPGDAIDAWSTVVTNYPQSAKAAEAAFRAGDTYFKGGDYEKAISLFRFVTDRFPYSSFSPSAQAFIGQCYYNQRRYTDAIREHQKFLDLYPTDPQAQSVRRNLEMDYYRAGLYAMENGDTALMQEFMKRFPESELGAQARFDRALALMAAKDYLAAAQEFQTVVVNFPGSSFAPKAQLNTGECFATAGKWEQARDAYERYLKYFPDGTDRDAAQFNLGISYFHLEEFQKAQQCFQVVIDSFPDSQYVEGARKNVEISRKRLGLQEE